MPSGVTRVAGVIGDPVEHSLSPALHNAAFAAAGLDWVYVAFPVAAGRGAEAVRAASTLHLAGLSVTAPHKTEAAGAVDRLTLAAEALGAVNTVIPTPGGLVGDSTDGAGMLDALAADPGFDPGGRRCVVLGTGGAARAATLALARAGAVSVVVVGRDPAAAAACAALAGAAGRTGPVSAVGDAHLVVDATGAGMRAAAPFGLGGAGAFAAGQVVLDLVYAPPVTPLLAAAAAAGATVSNGLGMLLHQAARQWSAWTGEPAPLDAMAAAVGLSSSGVAAGGPRAPGTPSPAGEAPGPR